MDLQAKFAHIFSRILVCHVGENSRMEGGGGCKVLVGSALSPRSYCLCVVHEGHLQFQLGGFMIF